MPFSGFLKKYFSANKKFGSKDRKQVASLCYNFYRLGNAMPAASVEEKILAGTFLCEQSNNEFLNFHKPEWNLMMAKPIDEKINFLAIDLLKLFLWGEELSGGVDLSSFSRSFFKQPDLFLRTRPGQKDIVVNKLLQAGLQFEIDGDDCLILPNTTKLETLLALDKEAVVQDYNSQKVLDGLKTEKVFTSGPLKKVWDCCAASGGKSILAYDILGGKMELTVSDIRESILLNLKKRFSAAGIKNYHSFVTDLSSEKYSFPDQLYSLVICDAPCTGSGTWSRTPEQLHFFKAQTITSYAAAQRKIVTNVIPQLQKGGLFIYITCSVFKKENEEIANFINEKFHLQQLQVELLKGYDKKADSMFAAVFRKE